MDHDLLFYSPFTLQGGSGAPHRQSLPTNALAGNFVDGSCPQR